MVVTYLTCHALARKKAMAPLDRAEVERTVIHTISRIRGYPEEKIHSDTDLVVDLGIAGDDADLVFLEILKLYPINFSDAHLYRYFGSEGLALWQGPVLISKILTYPIQRWVLRKSPKEILGQRVLVSDVVDSVMAGKWTLD